MKRIYAIETAGLLGIDFEDMADYELYAALEEAGYDWNGEEWVYAE